MRGAKGGVFRGRAHGKFVKVGFTQDYRTGGFELLDHRRIVGGLEVLEHLGRTGGAAKSGAHVVFKGDRDATQRANRLARGP